MISFLYDQIAKINSSQLSDFQKKYRLVRFTDLLAIAHAKAGQFETAIECYQLAKEVHQREAAPIVKEKFSKEDLDHYRKEIWSKISEIILQSTDIREPLRICFNHGLRKEFSSLYKSDKFDHYKKAQMLNDEVAETSSEALLDEALKEIELCDSQKEDVTILKAQLMLKKASFLALKRDYKKGIAILESALQFSPQNRELIFFRPKLVSGIVSEYLKKEQYEEAIALCKKELSSSIKPPEDTATLHYLYAIALNKQGKFQESIQECDLAVQTNHLDQQLQKNALALKAYEEGMLFFADKKHYQAMRKFEEALKYRSRFDSLIRQALNQLQEVVFPTSCSGK